MPPAYRLAPFDAAHPAPARTLAQLQMALLPTSPLALLGPRFLERFYYRLLPSADLIFGAIAYVDDRPAGCIVGTADADGFMAAAIRRWWWRLGGVLATSVLLAPARIGAVWEAWRIMRHAAPAATSGPCGEMLTFGVLTDFRSAAFIKKTGLHIASDLFDDALAQMRARNTTSVRAIVDADNTAAKLFYLGRGWTLARTGVPGWLADTVEFVRPD